MSIKKQYLKTKSICKVTFSVPKRVVKSVATVQLLGDFNNWNVKETPLKKTKDGKFLTELELEPGKEYQFRYLIDHTHWLNDLNADKYVPSGVGYSENSVVVL
ncbi:MAG: glycoside hydrolase [Bacteroidetes bacterium RIFOXYB2_FULL_35_7]|nr:MAG: glycoside hydrolase [Bacteroidetes bacterium GWF2_35_48]OFY93446.1 MAG: glycoside hydrolase [Bacteroidetes bacterium RIFOXYB2_FULL_35_7]HBX50844.1 glycoside hydrolase [Bacteroidales bacterium]